MGRVDAIERTVTVDAPASRVWAALTVAEELAQWFGDSAEVDLRPGGAIKLGWSEYDATAAGRVEVVDEPRTFAFSWDVGADDDGTIWSTKVTFTLDEEAGRTVVTVVESGLATLPDDLHERTLRENASGWEGELADLERYLESVPA